MKKEIGLAIIGAGIAGVAAAVYAKRSGLEFTIFESGGIGGQLLLMESIDNYIGLKLGTKGRELTESLVKTLKDLEIGITSQEILKVELEGKKIILHTSKCIYSAKGAIIATGANFAKLGFKGEAEFLGKGVSFCAVCDGFFFKGKDVMVVGGGNTAVEEAVYLAEIANKVILVHRRNELRAMEYLKKQLLAKDNIEVVFDSVVKEARGGNLLEEVLIENVKNRKSQTLATAGLFVAIGIKPNTEIFKNVVSQEEKGYIITDENMQSSVNLIWACGDCRKRPLKQLITAASEGATAALSAYKYLKGHYISV